MAFGDIVRSFAFAPLNPYGVSFDGKNLLVRSEATGQIYSVDRATGALVRRFASQGNVIDIHYEDGKVFETRHIDNHVLYCDLAGNLIKDLGAVAGATLIFGIGCLHDGMLVIADYTGTRLWFVEKSSARVINSWNVGFGCFGVCFDGKDVYIGKYSVPYGLYKFDLIGNLLRSVALGLRPMGLVHDGKYLWTADDLNDKIYCVSVN